MSALDEISKKHKESELDEIEACILWNAWACDNDEQAEMPRAAAELLASLRADLAQARAENERLRGRVEELEKLIENDVRWHEGEDSPRARLEQCAYILAHLEDDDHGRRFPTKEECAFARAVLAERRHD